MEKDHADGYNRKFFDVLMNEIPEYDLEGQKITKLNSVQGLDVKKGQKVDEKIIALAR